MSLEVIREPALLIQDPSGTPLYFHFKEGCTLNVVQQRFDVMHNGANLGARNQSQLFEITGRPVGEWENLSTLFPHMSANIGTRLIGDSDVAWRLITASGRQWTFDRGAITKRPGLMAKVGDTLLGEMTVSCVYSTTNSRWHQYAADGTHPGFASLSPSNILTLAPAVAWGSSPHDELYPTEGVEVAFDWELTPVIYNGQIIDWTISGQTMTANLVPQHNATFAQMLTKMGGDLAMGAIIPTANLVISYSGFYAMLYAAELQPMQFQFKHSENFFSGIQGIARQTYATGSAVALGYVGTSAPS
jgi:hypothetical protein